jgi:hypothetical protein
MNRKSLSKTTRMFKDKENGVKIKLQAPSLDYSGNYVAKPLTESAIFGLITLCSYATIFGYGSFRQKEPYPTNVG